MVKNPPANEGNSSLTPGLGRPPWRRKWQPTPVFLPGESHGQGSLVSYSLRGGVRVRHDSETKQQHPSEDPQFHVNVKYSNSEREAKSQKWLLGL